MDEGWTYRVSSADSPTQRSPCFTVEKSPGAEQADSGCTKAVCATNRHPRLCNAIGVLCIPSSVNPVCLFWTHGWLSQSISDSGKDHHFLEARLSLTTKAATATVPRLSDSRTPGCLRNSQA